MGFPGGSAGKESTCNVGAGTAASRGKRCREEPAVSRAAGTAASPSPVYLWQIHVDVWQNQYNIVKFKNKIKLKKKKKYPDSLTQDWSPLSDPR